MLVFKYKGRQYTPINKQMTQNIMSTHFNWIVSQLRKGEDIERIVWDLLEDEDATFSDRRELENAIQNINV